MSGIFLVVKPEVCVCVHTSMAEQVEEGIVSLVDVLEEDEELQQEASAVLGASDSEKCSYPEVNNTHTPWSSLSLQGVWHVLLVFTVLPKHE